MTHQHIIRLILLPLLLGPLLAFAAGEPTQQAMLAKPDPAKLWLRSHAAMVVDQRSGQILYEKRADETLPIASLTKLMTAMVVLDGNLDMNEIIKITRADKDTLKFSRSRLPVGTRMTRSDMLKMALMASENRAAAALARTWPGGRKAFYTAMNNKARDIGLNNTYFAESTGLQHKNISTARDMVRLMQAAWGYPRIRELSRQAEDQVWLFNKKAALDFRNTNRLTRRPRWQIGLSKTGYIKESGRCLAMQTTIAGRDLLVVLLNAQGRLSSFGDSGRIRQWLETFENHQQAQLKTIKRSKIPG